MLPMIKSVPSSNEIYSRGPNWYKHALFQAINSILSCGFCYSVKQSPRWTSCLFLPKSIKSSRNHGQRPCSPSASYVLVPVIGKLNPMAISEQFFLMSTFKTSSHHTNGFIEQQKDMSQYCPLLHGLDTTMVTSMASPRHLPWHSSPLLKQQLGGHYMT